MKETSLLYFSFESDTREWNSKEIETRKYGETRGDGVVNPRICTKEIKPEDTDARG